MAIPRPSPHVPDPPDGDDPEPLTEPEQIPNDDDLGPLDEDAPAD